MFVKADFNSSSRSAGLVWAHFQELRAQLADPGADAPSSESPWLPRSSPQMLLLLGASIVREDLDGDSAQSQIAISKGFKLLERFVRGQLTDQERGQLTDHSTAIGIQRDSHASADIVEVRAIGSPLSTAALPSACAEEQAQVIRVQCGPSAGACDKLKSVVCEDQMSQSIASVLSSADKPPQSFCALGELGSTGHATDWLPQRELQESRSVRALASHHLHRRLPI